jgi:hypothetical protein
MLRIAFYIIFSSLSLAIHAQSNRVEWQPNYSFSLSDFKNPGTRVDSRLEKTVLQPGIIIELGFQMSGVEFMFTRNFNEKVICSYDPGSALILAQSSFEANELLKLAAFDFDLSELHARKIRKGLFENKKTFSDVDFFQPFYDKIISERNTESSRVYQESNFGKDAEVLQTEHDKVKKAILALSEYCKSCKPPKKKSN